LRCHLLDGLGSLRLQKILSNALDHVRQFIRKRKCFAFQPRRGPVNLSRASLGRHGKASLFLGRKNPSRALARGMSTIVTRWGAIFKRIAEFVTGRTASAPVFLLKLLRRHGTL